jgi:small subunit ribosomal protein S10
MAAEATKTKKKAPASAKTAAGKPAARARKVAAPVIAQRLRIKVRAYEHKVLDASVKQILDTALRYDAKVAGPIPLPTEIKKYTVNRSTFIYKDAREQFEMRVHKRVIDILDPSPKVIDALTNLSLPSGVTIDVKMA